MTAQPLLNVALFLVPKRGVAWIPLETSFRHAFLRLEESGYTAIPVLDRAGHYVGTVTEGDLLRHLMYATKDISVAGTEHIPLSEVSLRTKNTAVDIKADLPELIQRSIEQTFVPVQDDRGVFVGIVRRREIIEYCTRVLLAKR